ncbi:MULTISPECIES: DUF1611 domain-containing protein [Halococcus]|uniref:DUF1611 domain-containing protein n=1 Tax=Halococcus TaxID=2249 RepID=UPI000E7317DE|nr:MULTISPECIES: DUF1611 domain-containing protein [Halococcus]RJT03214.1 DUF1611 domain-containing protein [Halococcus sp. IIIV-5B]
MATVLLAHEKFPHRAKTAVSILRYADDDVVAVLDRANAGRSVHDFLPDVQDAPIVSGMDEVERCDELIIGIAPIGGGFEDSWRADVRTALERGCDVTAGLHSFLNDDEEFRELADEHGCELTDVRNPPDDLGVSEGRAGEVDAEVILTVGTDCSVGKMTVARELYEAARERGEDAAFIPTGQTGIMIEGWGNPIDRVVSDFTAGAVEEMILERADHDYLFVEGQASIVHPAYSAVTCGILHGAMPDELVLCHEAGRETIHGYEHIEIPPLPTYVERYESFAEPVHETEVVAGALNTRSLETDEGARSAVGAYTEALDVPATDLLRFGPEGVLEAVL